MRPWTPERRKRQSALAKARWLEPKFRKMQAELRKSRNADPDFQKHRLAACKKFWDDPVRSAKARANRKKLGLRDRKQHSKTMKDIVSRPEFRERLVERSRKIMKANWANPTWRERISALGKARFKNQKYRAHISKTMAETNRRMHLHKPTSLERLTHALLKKHKIRFKPEHLIKSAATSVDAFLPDHNIAVYADGDYWHRDQETKTKDLKINKRLNRLGIAVHRIREAKFESDFNRLLKRIKVV